jgi:phosphoglycerate dehydrogenase-like enzyme
VPKPRLVFLRPFGASDRAFLRAALDPAFDVVEPPAFDDATLAAAVGDADAVLGARLGPAVLDAARRLKLVQTPGAGLDGLDLAALSRRVIMVANSHSNAGVVAEYALGMLLALAKGFVASDRGLRASTPPAVAGERPQSLAGGTVGLLGLGHVAQALLPLLAPFRVSLLAAARRPQRHQALCEAFPALTLTDVDDLLQRADAIVVTLPLTPQTRGLLDARRLALMPASTLLINVGRAEVIDRQALLAALAFNPQRRVGLDVWWSDRADADAADFAPYTEMLLTPHRAGSDAQCSPHLVGIVTNLLAFAQHGRPVDLVDCAAGY